MRRRLSDRLDVVTATVAGRGRPPGRPVLDHPHAVLLARLAEPMRHPGSTALESARARLAALHVAALLREPGTRPGPLVGLLGAVRDAERDTGDPPDREFWAAVGHAPEAVDGMRAAYITNPWSDVASS